MWLELIYRYDAGHQCMTRFCVDFCLPNASDRLFSVLSVCVCVHGLARACFVLSIIIKNDHMLSNVV